MYQTSSLNINPFHMHPTINTMNNPVQTLITQQLVISWDQIPKCNRVKVTRPTFTGFCQIVSDLKSVRALKMRLVAPMQEQIGTLQCFSVRGLEAHVALLRPWRNVLLGCQFVWESIFGTLDNRLRTFFNPVLMNRHLYTYPKSRL